MFYVMLRISEHGVHQIAEPKLFPSMAEATEYALTIAKELDPIVLKITQADIVWDLSCL